MRFCQFLILIVVYFGISALAQQEYDTNVKNDGFIMQPMLSGEAVLIIPSQIAAGVTLSGYQRSVEGDLYLAGDLVSQYPGGGRPSNAALGARARIVLGSGSSYFLEVGGAKYLLAKQEQAAFRKEVSIGLGKFPVSSDSGFVSYGLKRISVNPSNEYPNDRKLNLIYIKLQGNPL